jgi:hypothetical protein
MKNTKTSTLEKIAELRARVHAVCHFLPLAVSVAWLLFYLTNPANLVVNVFFAPVMIVGWVAALLATPLKFIVMTFKLIAGGWTVGFCVFPFFPMCFLTGFIGAVLGFGASVMIALYAPAAVTIFAFFEKFGDSEDDSAQDEDL